MARNHYDFTNQRAIVTGGAQGIGRAIVDRLVAGSAMVAIWDMDHSRAALQHAQACLTASHQQRGG